MINVHPPEIKCCLCTAPSICNRCSTSHSCCSILTLRSPICSTSRTHTRHDTQRIHNTTTTHTAHPQRSTCTARCMRYVASMHTLIASNRCVPLDPQHAPNITSGALYCLVWTMLVCFFPRVVRRVPPKSITFTCLQSRVFVSRSTFGVFKSV